MQCRSHSRRRTIKCLFVTACRMDEYAEEKRTEKNLIVRSGISEAETTNNKKTALNVLYWSYTDTKHRAASLRQQSFLFWKLGCIPVLRSLIRILRASLVQIDTETRCWHVTISCQPDGRPPQPVRPWKSVRIHVAEGSNVVVLELPYSTEFGRDSRKFASGVRKYGKFSHFLTHLVVYGGQGKNKYYPL